MAFCVMGNSFIFLSVGTREFHAVLAVLFNQCYTLLDPDWWGCKQDTERERENESKVWQASCLGSLNGTSGPSQEGGECDSAL